MDKKDLGPNSIKIDGILDDDEKRQSVTSNSSPQTKGFNGIRKAWILPELTEVEVGAMQHAGMWTAYTPGSLKRNFS